MGELKIKISDEIEKKFREHAFKRYGYRKGALSIAAERALIEVMKRPKAELSRNLFLKSAGTWKDIDAKSLIKKIYESRAVSTRKKVEFE